MMMRNSITKGAFLTGDTYPATFKGQAQPVPRQQTSPFAKDRMGEAQRRLEELAAKVRAQRQRRDTLAEVMRLQGRGR